MAQKNATPHIIQHLLSYKKEIPVVNGWFKNLLPQDELPGELQKEYQYLVKTRGNLYCGINGTGRLYKISDSSDKIIFRRTDSTYYSGSDFFAANFTIGDNIYSYGGYGFWKTNGLLRNYNSYSREWDIQKINKEIPCNFHAGSGFWADSRHKLVYVTNPVIRNEGLKSDTSFSSINGRINSSGQKIYVLDLITGMWQDLSLSSHVPLNLTPSPWGMWNIGDFNFTYIFNLLDNKIYVSSKEFNKKSSKIFNNIEKNVWFFIDSTLYAGNLELNTFDSLRVSINDFEDTGKPVYTVANESTQNKVLFWGLLSVIIAGLIVFTYILRRRINEGKMKGVILKGARGYTETVKDLSSVGFFTVVETELIKYVHKKTSEKYPVSIEEVNKLLGLSDKTDSIQKKNRSDIINSINQKWALANNSKLPLLKRQRSNFDKRSFEYSIQSEWMDRIKEML
jgi:hypothetical protein